MTLATTTSLGRATAGENETLLLPANHVPNQTKTGMVWCHGAGGSHTAVNNTALAGQWKIARALAETWPLVGSYLTGDNWGSSTGVARVADCRTFLQGTVGAKAGPIILCGVSMGGLTALNYYKAYPANVAAVILMIPMTDMTHARSTGFLAAINTAYGTYVAATHNPTSDPSTYVKTLGAAPIRVYYAPNDTTALQQYILNMEASLPSYDAISVGNLEHSEAAIQAIDTVELVTWLKSKGL